MKCGYVSPFHALCARRSPLRGAWIEIQGTGGRGQEAGRRSPSWGAWIEIFMAATSAVRFFVAPPRGERGLKYRREILDRQPRQGRSPSWGAWIEIRFRRASWARSAVAPPRGERGLKYILPICHGDVVYRRSPSWGAWIEIRVRPPVKKVAASLPLVGSVD